jgi:O-antigen ligase
MSALVALAAAHCLISPAGKLSFTPLVAAVVFLTAWMAVTNKWASPSYTAAAPYHAAFLLGGFFLGRRAGPANVHRLFGAALAFAICLAGWAIWQRVNGEPRAHALFETPATLVSTINLVLLPGLVFLLVGKRRTLLLAALLILVTAFMAGTSRGGWLSLAIGGLVAYRFFRHADIRIQPKAVFILVGIFALAWLLASLAPYVWNWTMGTIGPVGVAPGTRGYSMLEASESSVARLELYELAWRSVAPSSLFTGFGYLGYYYLLESGRAGIANYDQASSYFVHNDYLQTLLELGIPGLAGLLTVVALPLIAAWRSAPKLEPDSRDRLILVALVAALASMATHAFVDFPFYIPVCLLMYGAIFGVLDSLLLRATREDTLQRAHPAIISLRKGAIAAAATLGVWVLATPVAAEGAAGYAYRQWRSAQGESAAYWFEVARRIEPRDWRYCWYAGQFWFAQAAQSRKPEAARLADQAFADGFAANPREGRNLLGRIATHLRLRALLDAPADAVTLLVWGQRAVELAPNDTAARMELALLRKQLGSLSGDAEK